MAGGAPQVEGADRVAPQGAENDEEFRGEYLRYIANALDRLELLGLSMRHRPRLSLSVAYLSLTVSEPDDDPRNGAATADKWFAAQDDHRRTRTRVESALTNRTLVRGDAGSGKTTLLDWLAVTAAQGGFTGRLGEWNGCVPLPIRLRRYADSPLPAPEQFLDETAKWLVGLMPPGWVHRCLRSPGRRWSWWTPWTSSGPRSGTRCGNGCATWTRPPRGEGDRHVAPGGSGRALAR